MTSAAIMQPTYLPWLGYFGLMDRVDVFILLDSVQFARRSWQQRNQIKTAQGAIWLTVPALSKGAREQLIRDVVIDRSRDFPDAHIRSIELNYRRSPYFDTYAPELFSILRGGQDRLAILTIELIGWLRDRLGITTPLRCASEINTAGRKADLLAALCEEVAADHYVSPPGSKDYMNESTAFSDRGIAVSYHEFAHPTYPQQYGDFLPHVSVIDLMFNTGPDSLAIIRRAVTEGA